MTLANNILDLYLTDSYNKMLDHDLTLPIDTDSNNIFHLIFYNLDKKILEFFKLAKSDIVIQCNNISNKHGYKPVDYVMMNISTITNQKFYQWLNDEWHIYASSIKEYKILTDKSIDEKNDKVINLINKLSNRLGQENDIYKEADIKFIDPSSNLIKTYNINNIKSYLSTIYTIDMSRKLDTLNHIQELTNRIGANSFVGGTSYDSEFNLSPNSMFSEVRGDKTHQRGGKSVDNVDRYDPFPAEHIQRSDSRYDENYVDQYGGLDNYDTLVSEFFRQDIADRMKGGVCYDDDDDDNCDEFDDDDDDDSAAMHRVEPETRKKYNEFLEKLMEVFDIDEEKARKYRNAIKITVESSNPELKGFVNDKAKVDFISKIFENNDKLKKFIDNIDMKKIDKIMEERKKEYEARQSENTANKSSNKSSNKFTSKKSVNHKSESDDTESTGLTETSTINKKSKKSKNRKPSRMSNYLHTSEIVSSESE